MSGAGLIGIFDECQYTRHLQNRFDNSKIPYSFSPSFKLQQLESYFLFLYICLALEIPPMM